MAQERALKAGDTFKECGDCPEVIVVPAGRFMMGSPAGQDPDDERPQHEVTIAEPIAVAKFPLTFDEWDACARLGGCRRDVSDNSWGRGRRPVINVSWDDAQAYVKWLSGITDKTMPIPVKPPVCNGMIAPRDSWMMPPPCNEMIPPGAPRLLAERVSSPCGVAGQAVLDCLPRVRRRLSPVNSMRCALWTRRSRMASA